MAKRHKVPVKQYVKCFKNDSNQFWKWTYQFPELIIGLTYTNKMNICLESLPYLLTKELSKSMFQKTVFKLNVHNAPQVLVFLSYYFIFWMLNNDVFNMRMAIKLIFKSPKLKVYNCWIKSLGRKFQLLDIKINFLSIFRGKTFDEPWNKHWIVQLIICVLWSN